MDLLKNILSGMANTKATFDSGIETLISMASLPTRSDVTKLQRKLDVTERTLINLSRRIDRLAAAVERNNGTPAKSRTDDSD